MSPERGGKQASSGKSRGSRAAKRPSGPEAARRRGLLLFGVLFVVLFAIVAISEGIGDPSIPGDDVILIEEAPGDVGHITKAEFDHAMVLAAAQGGQKKVPKEGKKYEELKETALSGMIESAWLEGQAAEMGIEATDAEVAKEFKKIKGENFPKESEFKKFLKETKFTQQDIDERVKLQILSTEIQEQLKEEPPTPSDSEVEDYYEAAKATQFTQPASRSIRLIRNKDEAKAEQALKQLEAGNTAKDWAKVAKELSEDPATKGKGGLQQNVADGTLEEPLDSAIVDAPEGQLEGPLKTPTGFVVFEVQNSSPETVEELKGVEGQIRSQLTQQLEQDAFNEFISDFNARWTSRTFCADGYVIERCANFEGSGRPASAPPACYEEDPKGPRPDCPAPVFQAIPAAPGSITPLEPQGKPLAQRPHPPGEEKAAEAPPAGLPGGAVPPPAE
ncbi:MAG TPA: peptidyl-prolyl cis-trans isomerase [Solirubrobacterales bacterium]|nr:peptidyl-prolyl cis-trans isomerase [Solirubrobacterales bacterium]